MKVFLPLLYRACQFPPLDLEKVFDEIMLEVLFDPRPYSTHSPQKKDDSSTRYVTPNFRVSVSS